MRDDERRQLESQLVVMGLNGLSDQNFVPQMAMLINQHPGFSSPHSFFIGMINECEQSKRTEMYEALRPHLKFDVWPLERYEAKLREHAANVESHSQPIALGEDVYQEVAIEDATGCIVRMTCHKCTRWEEYYGDTPVEAALNARAAGWVRDVTIQKEICPKCPAIRLN